VAVAVGAVAARPCPPDRGGGWHAAGSASGLAPTARHPPQRSAAELREAELRGVEQHGAELRGRAARGWSC